KHVEEVSIDVNSERENESLYNEEEERSFPLRSTEELEQYERKMQMKKEEPKEPRELNPLLEEKESPVDESFLLQSIESIDGIVNSTEDDNSLKNESPLDIIHSPKNLISKPNKDEFEKYLIEFKKRNR